LKKTPRGTEETKQGASTCRGLEPNRPGWNVSKEDLSRANYKEQKEISRPNQKGECNLFKKKKEKQEIQGERQEISNRKGVLS